MKNCADRGMVSEANIREIERNGFNYILLGVRAWNAKHIGNKLIFDKSPFEVVKENLHVKEVRGNVSSAFQALGLRIPPGMQSV